MGVGELVLLEDPTGALFTLWEDKAGRLRPVSSAGRGPGSRRGRR